MSSTWGRLLSAVSCQPSSFEVVTEPDEPAADAAHAERTGPVDGRASDGFPSARDRHRHENAADVQREAANEEREKPPPAPTSGATTAPANQRVRSRHARE